MFYLVSLLKRAMAKRNFDLQRQNLVMKKCKFIKEYICKKDAVENRLNICKKKCVGKKIPRI